MLPNSNTGQWKFSEGSARYRGNCEDSLPQEIVKEIAPISEIISGKKSHKKGYFHNNISLAF